MRRSAPAAPGPPPGRVTGLVLCGGASSRMGGDKALIVIDGDSLLRRAVDVLDGVAGQVRLACGETARYAELGRPLTLDRITGVGPLAGLAAGLEDAETEWTVALACDMPRVDAGVLGALLERAQVQDLDVCLSRGARGLEPLCAVYRKTCLPSIQDALAAGQRRMVSFWRGAWAERRAPLRVGILQLARDSRVADPTINLNSPWDLEEERRHRAEMGS